MTKQPPHRCNAASTAVKCVKLSAPSLPTLCMLPLPAWCRLTWGMSSHYDPKTHCSPQHAHLQHSAHTSLGNPCLTPPPPRSSPHLPAALSAPSLPTLRMLPLPEWCMVTWGMGSEGRGDLPRAEKPGKLLPRSLGSSKNRCLGTWKLMSVTACAGEKGGRYSIKITVLIKGAVVWVTGQLKDRCLGTWKQMSVTACAGEKGGGYGI